MLTGEWRIAVDIGVVARGQVVLGDCLSTCIFGVPAYGRDIAGNVELDYFAQAVKFPIVEKATSQRDVAQRRCAEQAAVLVLPELVLAFWAAGAEVEEGGIAIARNRRIARHAERDQAVVGERR